jgi:hypothetical protein
VDVDAVKWLKARDSWVKLLKSKDQAIIATCQFLKMVQTQFDTQVVKFMSDGGGEY